MIIVSQDKVANINYNNIEATYLLKKDDEVEINVRGNYDYTIGKYKTEERAKEVLQEIVKQKAMFALFRTAPTGGKEQTEMLEKFAQKKIILDTYETPKE